MALDISGIDGELRTNGKRLAQLTSWQKRNKRITFTVGYVNAFLAGLGPPNEIAVQVTPKVRRIYAVTAGTLESGRVDVDLMTVRSEKTL